MPFKELLAIQSRVFAYLKPYWKVVLGAGFFTVFVALARLSQAKLLGLLFALINDAKIESQGVLTVSVTPVQAALGGGLLDRIKHASPLQQLNCVVVAFIILVGCRGFGWYLQRYLTDLAAQSAVRDIRAQIFAHLQDLSLGYFESTRLGEIQSRATSDVIGATSIYSSLADFLKNLLVVVGAVSTMFYKDYLLTLLVLLLGPLVGVAVVRFGKRVGAHTEVLQSLVADLSSIVLENTSSQKTIKANHREAFEKRRHDGVNEQNFQVQMKLVRIAATQTPLVELLSVIGIIAIIYVGTARILTGQATLPSMVEYWALLAIVIQPITTLASFFSALHAASAAAKRAFLLLDTIIDVKEKPTAVVLPTLKGHLKFTDVVFTYETGKEVLRGINLEVSPGEVVALVGTNGAGKTSLVNLVPRFYDPTSGAITVDGYDLRDVTLGSLRLQIGTVIQESVLFSGTIMDNIACGGQGYSQENIIQAARVANAHEFITRLPLGYATDIGERGVRLSGGQRQRIAIARTVLREPRILILDEFTSGIDTESESLISEAIERVMRGRTCLIIAHRLATIKQADRIIVLDSGQIAEEGQHDELLAVPDGIYAKLYVAQLRNPRNPVLDEPGVSPLCPPA